MKISPVIYAAAGALVLIGLFLALKPGKGTVPPAATSSAQQASSSPTQSNTKIFELFVKNRKLVSGPETLKVNEGDDVTIRITADEDEELHLHGYDKSVDLTKNQPADLNFTASLTGRFPYELEKSKTEIGTLEVQPR